MKNLGEYLTECIAVFKSSTEREVVEDEFKTIVSNSLYPGLLFMLLVTLELDITIVPASWILVIYLTRLINAKELPFFEKLEKQVYKCVAIWMKIGVLVLSLFVSKIGVAFIQSCGWILEDALLIPGAYILNKSILKWMVFIQYFSFYRAYLYIFMAFGSYLSPKIKATAKRQQENKEKKDAKKKQ